MEDWGGPVDQATIQRWVVKESPFLAAAWHRRKRPGWVSWRVDETSMQPQGPWYDLSWAVDKHGQTINVLITEQRDEAAAPFYALVASSLQPTGFTHLTLPSRENVRRNRPFH
jgi:putative transposase